jgi:CheY-like chemotaxis protein
MMKITRARAAALAHARMLLASSPPPAAGRTAVAPRQWGSDAAQVPHDPPAPATRGAPTTGPRTRVRILIVDDEYRIRLALRTCLEAEGYVVDEARDGREAIDAVALGAPDVMVVDLAMPVLDGLSVLREVACLDGARPRVIVLTAYGSISAAEMAHDLGAVAFLEKPVMPESLRAAVALALRAK